MLFPLLIAISRLTTGPVDHFGLAAAFVEVLFAAASPLLPETAVCRGLSLGFRVIVILYSSPLLQASLCVCHWYPVLLSLLTC
jgi:hypothetical protein